MRYHFTLLEWPSSKRQNITNAGEDVEKREPLCTVGGNVNWYSHCGEQYGEIRFVVTRGRGWRVGELDEGGQKLHTPSYKTNKS